MQLRHRGMLRFILGHGVTHPSPVVFVPLHEAANTTCARRRGESGRKKTIAMTIRAKAPSAVSFRLHLNRNYRYTGAGCSHRRSPAPSSYCTRDRRRWTRMNSTTKNRTAQTTRMSVTLSIAIASLLLVGKKRFERLRDHNAGRTKSDDKQ